MGYAVRMHLPLVQVPVPAGERWAYPSQACFTPAENWLDKPINVTGSPKEDEPSCATWRPRPPGSAGRARLPWGTPSLIGLSSQFSAGVKQA